VQGLISTNPAEGITVESDRHAVSDDLSYLTQSHIELLLSCAECAAVEGERVSDMQQLVDCPHMPLEKRVAFTLAVHQCPRAGELAAMDWSRIELEREVWHITMSWDGPTKSGKKRTQALLPRSCRALRVWWQACGKPTKGLLFPSTRRQKGTKAVRYAEGYDWGWADTPAATGFRPGWWRRVGIDRQVRFHDMRDTAATHLLSGTWGKVWPIKNVSEHLGHSTVAVTEARYAHLTTDSKVALARLTESDANTDQTQTKTPKKPPSKIPDSSMKSNSSGGRTRTYDQSVNSPLHIPVISTTYTPSGPCLVRVCETSAMEHAERLLRGLGRGEWDLDCAMQMARAVLAERAYQLATQVLDMNADMVARALDLAGELVNTRPSEVSVARGARR
jgi:hypothetical protein